MLLAVLLLVPSAVGQVDPGDEPADESTVVDGVEVPRLRTLESRTYRLEDGRFTTVVSAGPVNFRGSDGRWQPIDSTLVPSSRGGFAWENRANAYSVLLPDRPGREPVRFEHDGTWVSFSLRNAPSVVPTIEKGTAKVVLGSGVSVSWIAGGIGLKEEITLENAQTANSFVFDLRLSPGLTPRVRDDGSIDFLRASGERAFSFIAPFMADSSRSEEGFSDAVSYELERSDAGYVLRLVADSQWLSDPARVWPVTIDPTITLEEPDDCHIASSPYQNNDQCSFADLKIGYSSGDSAKRRLLVKFGLPDDLVGHNVTDADLALWCEDGTTTNFADIDLRRVTRSWTLDATWNKYNGTSNWTTAGGDFGTSDYATRNTNCSTVGWKLWTAAGSNSLADLVNFWLGGTYPNEGVLLKQQGETTNNLLTFTATDDAANESHWPELQLTFSNTAPAVPTLETPGASGEVPMISPVLTATDGVGDPVTDADGDEVSYRFEVADDSAFTQSRCVSPWLPTTNTWTVGPGDCGLEDGGTYYWRAQAQDPFEASAWSSGRAFDVSLAKLGENELWPMWEHEKLAVNQVNGNAVVSLPGPTYATAVGSMSASVTHNSLDPENRGLGTGWTLDAGDALSDPPSKLIDHGLMDHADGFDSVEIVRPSGESAYYNRVGESNTYISEPGDGSQLSKNEDGSWILLSEGEAIYTFGAADGTTFSAGLTSAELASADPGEGELTYSFSTDGSVKKLTMIEDAAGRQLVFTWNSLAPTLCPNAILCIEGPDGVVWEYVGDSGGGATGRLTTINNGTRDLFTVTYEGPTSSRIIEVQNANDLDPSNASPGYDGDHALEIAYDGSGRVDEVSEGPISGQTPDTSTWTFIYDTGTFNGPRTARTGLGRTRMIPPNQQGLGSPASNAVYYDSRGRKVEEEDVLGMITAQEFNELDQKIWSEDAEGNRTEYAWDEASSRLLSETGPDPDGGGSLGQPVTTYRYDETAIGTSGTPGPALEGVQASYYTNLNLAGRPYARKNDGNIDFAVGGGWPNLGGQTTNFSVRWTGNLVATTAGEYTFSTVGTDGVRLTVGDLAVIDEAGRTGAATTISTDEPISLTAGTHKIVLEYFARTTSGAQVALRWLGPGISDQVVPASALRPAWMNRTSVISPTGTVSFSHFADPASEKPDYELKKLGSTNVITSYEYDAVGRTIEKVTPNGNAGRTIDSGGNLSGSPDLDYATTWEYYGLNETAEPPATCSGDEVEQAGLLESMTHAGMAATTTVYDEAGRTASVTSGAGIRCETYDAEGRLTSSKAPTTYGGTSYLTTTYTYDPAGQQLSASAGSLTNSTVYNEADHELLVTDAHGAEVAFTYDAEGNEITRDATPTGTTLTTEYEYDADNRLTKVTDPANQEYSFTYDDRGDLKTVQYPNGTFSWMDYNDAGWLTAVYHRHGTLPSTLPSSVPSDSSPIVDFAYTYDIEGRKTQEVRSGGSLTTETTSYTSYDALSRLAEVILPDGTCRKYLFDLNSNRTEIKEGSSCGSVSTTETYAYSTTVLDQLTSVTETGQPAVSLTYESGGEVATRGSDTLDWDGRGRQTGGTFGSTTISYGFDPLGFRFERTLGSQTIKYFNEGLFEKVGSAITFTEVDGPAGDLAHYQGRADLSPPQTFLYYNAHGDVAAEADDTGSRTAAYTYDPFGQLRSGTAPANTTSERFTGKWDKKLDTTSSLVEMGVRAYDTNTGRFLSVDPVEGGSCNVYDYACQDAVNKFDLDGRHVFGCPYCSALRVVSKWAVRGGSAAARYGWRYGSRAAVWGYRASGRCLSYGWSYYNYAKAPRWAAVAYGAWGCYNGVRYG